jgi:hypothetical protein
MPKSSTTFSWPRSLAIPSQKKKKTWLTRLDNAGPNRRQAKETCPWALLNHKEFLFQH